MPSYSHKKYLTSGELARELGVSIKTVRRWEKQGRIKSERTMGGHRRFNRAEVVLALKARDNNLTPQEIIHETPPLVETPQHPRRVVQEVNEAQDIEEQGFGEGPEIKEEEVVEVTRPRLQEAEEQEIVEQELSKEPEVIARPSHVIEEYVEEDSKEQEFGEETEIPVQEVSEEVIGEQDKKEQPKASTKRSVRRGVGVAFAIITLATIVKFPISAGLGDGLLSGITLFSSDKGIKEPDVLASTVSVQDLILAVEIPANFSEDVEITTNLTIGDSLAVGNAADITGNLNVGGNANVIGDQSVGGTVTVAGGALLSPADTFELVNDAVTTLNIGGAATGVSLGATTGTFTINNATTILNSLTLNGTLTFEGATADANETVFSITNPTVDRTITFPDLTGEVSLLGQSIGGSEIADSAINEVKLSTTNDPTNDYVLSYDQDSGGFTWVANAAAVNNLWTDGGVVTYLTTTSDDLSIGSSSNVAKLGVVGDSDEIQFLVRAHSTQTSNLAVFEQSSGTDVVTISNSGLINALGGVTLAAGTDLTIGSVGLNDVGSGASTSGASLIGVYDEFTNSNSTNLQDVLDDLDGAIGAGSSKFTQSTDLIYLTNTTDNVTIGGITSLAKLGIDGDADEVQLLVQAHSTQTSNVFVAENSSGTDLFSVDGSGNLVGAGDLAVNGGDITTSQTTFNLFNSTATTLNIGGAATTISLGASSGTTTVNNALTATGTLTANGALNANGTFAIGDGGDTGSLTTSDWSIGLTGDLAGIGAITSDGAIAFTPGSTNDITFNLDADSTVILSGVQPGTGSTLCLDGSNNVVTCTVGTGGVSTSGGTSGTIAKFTGAGSIGDSLITESGASLSLTTATSLSASSLTSLSLGAATVDFNGAGVLQYADGSNFTVSDDGGNNIFQLVGATNALSFGNATDNNTYTFLGSGSTTFSGNVNANGGWDVDDAFVVADGGNLTTTGTAAFRNAGGITLGLDQTTPTNNTAGMLTFVSAGDNAFATVFSAGTQTEAISYTLPTFVPNSDDYVLTTTSGGVLEWKTVVGIPGSGDITSIGDVTSGAAFATGSNQGTSLYFYDAEGEGQLTIANLTGPQVWTFPDQTGTVCLSSGNCAGGAGGSKWSDSGTTVYLTDTTDELVLGGSSPLSSAKFSIDGDADQIQLLIQGGSSQSTNVVEVENSGGTNLFTIDNSGNVNLAGDLTVTGNDIAGSGGTALTFTGTNVTVAGDLGITGGNVTTSTTFDLDLSVLGNVDLGNAASDTITATGSFDSNLNFLDADSTSYTIAGADATTATGSAGNLTVRAGAGGGTSGNGGNLVLSAGTVTSGTAGYIALQTNGTERLRLASDGTFLFEKGSNDLTLSVTAPTGASRIATIPSLAADDDFVFEDLIQTLTNKSLTSPTITGTPTASGATWTNLGTATTIDINGGTIDGTAIGGSTPSTGAFTTLSANSTVTLTNVGNSTGSALCLDGSNNVVTCTVGSGGIAGSGTAGQIAYFDSTGSITSEASGFGWDSTNDRLSIVSGNITGTTFAVTSNSLTTGEAFDITSTAAPSAGGTQSFVDINLTNSPTSSANTSRGIDLSLSDSTALSNTLYGAYVSVSNSSNTSAGTHTIYGGYFSSTGKTTGTTTAIGLTALAASADTNFGILADGAQGDIVGGTGSGDDLLLVSTTDATKGDIQFHSASYTINSSGQLTVATDETVNGIDVNAGAISDVTTLSQTGLHTITPSTTGTFLDFDLGTSYDSGDLVNIDWSGANTLTGATTGIDIDFANAATGNNATYGMRVNAPSSVGTGNQYGIYQQGTTWDYGAYFEDEVYTATGIHLPNAVPASTTNRLYANGDALYYNGATVSPWTDAGAYLYPTAGEALGNNASAGANKLSGVYLADNGPATFGTDNDWGLLYDETTDDRLELTTAGTSGLYISTAATSGTAYTLAADSVNTGSGFVFSLDALTTGTGVLVEAAGSSRTLSGDLFKINLGSGVTASGNLFTIANNNSNLFSVKTTKITSAIPHEFTAPGDVTVAYDLVLTNQTSGNIQSYGPLTIDAGESFENNNLTLKTYGTGLLNVEAGGGSLFTRSAGTVATFNRNTDDGTIVDLQQGGTSEGSISISGTTISYNAFTGSHYAWTEDTIEQGKLVKLTGDNKRYHDNDESEILYGIAETSVANDPAVLGSYLAVLEPSQEDGVENPHLVMAVGNGEMWVVDTGENIEPGDFLTSSDTKGHAQKEDDTYQVSYIVGRAAEKVDWSQESESVDGKKHKKISVFYDAFAKNNSGTAFATATGADYDLQTALAGTAPITTPKLTTTELTVLGDTILGDTTITGKLNVGTMVFDGLRNSLDAIGTLKIQEMALGNIELMGGRVEFDVKGNVSIKEGVIKGNRTFRSAETISGGSTSIRVNRSWDEAPVTINANATYDTYVWVENINSTGFTLRVKNAPGGDERIFWSAIW